MARLTLRLLFVGLMATPLAGCSSMQSWLTPDSKSEHNGISKSKLQGNAANDTDEEDEDANDAEESAADDRRAELVLDEPLDPWFGKYNYADKGRAIERNLR